MPPTPFIGFNCPVDNSIPAHPVQTVHPDGKDGHLLLSNSYPPSVADYAFTPQVGLTYTLNPDTVLRFSAGRIRARTARPIKSSTTRKTTTSPTIFSRRSGSTATRRRSTIRSVQYSDNYDASFERRFKGTDMSIKLTPYYRYATNQIYSIGAAVRAGRRPELAGSNASTASRSSSRKATSTRTACRSSLVHLYQRRREMGQLSRARAINPIDPYNQDIANFNGLTKAGGGSQCYENDIHGNVYPDPKLHAAQPEVQSADSAIRTTRCRRSRCSTATAGIPVGLDYAYLSPNVLSAIVNYKHNKFTITPALTFNEGRPTAIPPTSSASTRARARATPRLHQLADSRQESAAGRLHDLRSRGHAERHVPGCALHSESADRRRSTRSAHSGSRSSSTSACRSAIELSPRVKGQRCCWRISLNACFGGSSEPWTQAVPAELLHVRVHRQLLLRLELL